MTHVWKAQILGVGMMTPALVGLPHAAAARPMDIDVQNTTESLDVVSYDDAAIQLLQVGVFALTPAEKLKIGGGRIRLVQGAIRSGTERSQTRSGQRTDVHVGRADGANSRPRSFLSIGCGHHSCRCSNISGRCCALQPKR